jgi:hypothetical protein
MPYCFICYLETLQVLLLILFPLPGNNRGVTAKQMEEAVPIFNLLFYEKYIPHKYLSNFLQGLDPFFHKSDDGKCAFP